MKAFFVQQMDLIYFVYGLSFILVAIMVYFVHRLKPEQKFWKWLGFFGLIHGIVEWLDVAALSLDDNPILKVSKLLLIICSYFCLVEIVRQKLHRMLPWCGSWLYVPLACGLIWLGTSLDGIKGVSVLAKYMLGACGGMMAAWVLYQEALMTGKKCRTLMVLAVVLVLYAATHLLASRSMVFPSMIVNQELFLNWAGFPVQLVRMLLAGAMAVLVWQYYVLQRSQMIRSTAKRHWLEKDYLLPVGLLVVIAAGGVSANMSGHQQEDRMKERLFAVHSLVASNFDRLALERWTREIPGLQDPDYIRAVQDIHLALKYYPDVRDLHLLTWEQNGPVFLMNVDNLVDGRHVNRVVVPGEAYDDDLQVLRRVFHDKIQAVLGPRQDGGTFVSVFMPVRHAGLRPVVLGMDVDARHWARDVARQRLVSIAVTGVFVFLMIGFFVVLKREYESNRRLEEHKEDLEEIVRRRTEDLEKEKLKAEEASRLKTQFLFNVSHEIRTPLNGIVGFSELIARSQNLDRIHTMARTLLNEADILLALVNDVLDQGKLEEGKLTVFCAPVDVRQLMADVVKTVTISVNEKGLEFCLDIDDEMPAVIMADRLRLCQVLLNLLNNAIKFTEEGTIILWAQLLKREADVVSLRFSIADTGMGIPEDKKHLIFERFAQVDGALTRKYGGVGLGTSIAKNLVELMGGTMGFESREGVGTKFWCDIPFVVADAQEALPDLLEEIPEAVEASRHERGTVLVVEDYAINQDVIRAYLEQGGYKAVFVADGLEAVKACETKKYKLVLMDIQMPGIDGYDATRRIRSLGGWAAQVPVIGITANADDGTRALCLSAGMQDVLTKPLRQRPFLAMLARWISVLQEHGNKQPLAGSDVFDYARAVEEFGNDSVLVNDVVKKFIAQAKDQAMLMEEAIAMGDAKAIGAEAHKIKGAAANLTAVRLSECARVMENKGKACDLHGMKDLLEQLRQEISALECAMARVLCKTV